MKYYGAIGFSSTVEKPVGSGVWVEEIEERPYYGDITRWSKSWSKGESLNDDIDISNTISIVADPFVSTNVHNLRYATWNGAKWKIKSVDISYPRINLTLGGVYNEQATT